MTVSGTPLSPSFGTQEGSGRAVKHLWRESPPHPQGTGTLLTLLAMTAWAPCSSSRDGQQFCGCHSHGFRMVCPRCDSLGKESPRSLCFMLPVTLRYVRHLYTLRRENAVYAVTMIVFSYAHVPVGDLAFYPAKVLHIIWMASVFIRNTSEIFLSEQALKAYFRHLRHKPSECHAADVTFWGSVKNKSLTDGA